LRRFAYLGDGLFLAACVLYAANRWLLKPLAPHGPLGWWFSDLLLIPCALPVLLWIERKLGLRRHDRPPGAGEIAWLLVLWSVLFEAVAPRLLPHATADWRDVVAYAAGGLLAWAWWNRPTRAPS
jgi:hypothetical protein